MFRPFGNCAGAARLGGFARSVGVVASAQLKGGLASCRGLAVGFIAVLAFHGERREPGLARFTPAGVLADWPIEQVTFVEVGTAARHRSFRRSPGGAWRSDATGTADMAGLGERIETGLTLLHNSRPQRTDLAGEQLAEFGLTPPHLTLTVHMRDGATRTIEFGGTNPLGLERYARIAGRSEIMLLPSFVADAWEPVAQAR